MVSYLKSNLLLLIDTLLLIVDLFSNYKIYFEKNCSSSIIQNLLSSAGTASLEDPTMSSFAWYKNVLNILLSAMLENQTLSFGKPKTTSTDFPQGFPTWVQLQHPRFLFLEWQYSFSPMARLSIISYIIGLLPWTYDLSNWYVPYHHILEIPVFSGV